MTHFFQHSKPASRRLLLATYIGVIAGIISALVKSGFEDLIPPRMATTTPPPIVLLEKLGLDVHNMTYEWLGYTINWGGNGVHILFSIAIAVFYCLAIEYLPRIKLWHGIAFGLGGFHPSTRFCRPTNGSIRLALDSRS